MLAIGFEQIGFLFAVILIVLMRLPSGREIILHEHVLSLK